MTKHFKQTCDKPYDHHDYKMVYSNNQSVVVDSYEQVRQLWWETPSEFQSHIEVLDKTDTRPKGMTKGFV